MTFTELLAEVERGEARMLTDKAIGPSAIRLIIVQRADGSIWDSEAWYGERVAVPWSLPVLERVLASYHRGGTFSAGGIIDIEALAAHIQSIKAQDEVEAAVAAAEYLMGVRQ